VIAGMRVPQRIEQVVRAPIKKKGHDRAAQEDKGEDKFADKNSGHR
jgi:hypothetical protein